MRDIYTILLSLVPLEIFNETGGAATACKVRLVPSMSYSAVGPYDNFAQKFKYNKNIVS